MAELGRPVWLHPLLTMATPDYPNESVSKYDLWWAFGWPHETSVAMGRLVFAGVFDRWPQLTVITHHGGGTIPMCEGRIEHGLTELGTRNGPDMAHAVATDLREPPLTAFHRFYADTATFGSRRRIAMCLRLLRPRQNAVRVRHAIRPRPGNRLDPRNAALHRSP